MGCLVVCISLLSLSSGPKVSPPLFTNGPDSTSKDGPGKISEEVACEEQAGGSRGISRTQVPGQDAVLNES